MDTMQDAVRRALGRGHVIDITTTGRRTGLPRRIEIVFHNIDGRLYISGTPNPRRTRDWLRNLEADPRMTLHLKGAVRADLPATGRVVIDPAERKRVFDWIVGHAWRSMNVDAMQRWSPLIEVEPEGLAA
jgi:deazaflavin-dependent oxidoreductase (nitroreductase family)